MEDKKNRIYKAIMLVVLTAFVTFMITAFSMYSYYDLGSFAKNDNTINLDNITEIDTDTISTSKQSNIQQYLNKVLSAINKYYLWKDDIDEEKLKESAIEGYVAGLNDEYTSYIPAEEMKSFTEDITR